MASVDLALDKTPDPCSREKYLTAVVLGDKAAACCANARGTFLHPLSFPEAQETDLSHFVDQDRDVPILCLIPSCNKIFGGVTPVVEKGIAGEKKSKEGCNRTVEVKSENSFGSIAHENDSSEGPNSKGIGAEVKVDIGCASFCPKEDGEIPKLEFSHKDQWLRHLFLTHKLVLDNVTDICSLRR